MNNPPLVSVLMTAYNREKFIAEAIESVLASHYTNFELNIVDDCSNDNSFAIAKEYQLKDSRVFVYKNNENRGDYHNRNIAASYAKGVYIKYHDSDDILYPFSLNIIVAAMEKYPAAAYGFSYRHHQLNEHPFPKLVDSASAYKEHYQDGGFFYAGPGSSILRRDIFNETGGFSGSRFVGDTELWMKLSQKHSCVVFQSSLMWWRTHAGQEFQKGNQGTDYIVMNYQNDLHFLNSPGCPLDSKTRKAVLGNIQRILWRKIFSAKMNRQLYIKTKPPFSQFFLSFIPVNRIRKPLANLRNQ